MRRLLSSRIAGPVCGVAVAAAATGGVVAVLLAGGTSGPRLTTVDGIQEVVVAAHLSNAEICRTYIIVNCAELVKTAERPYLQDWARVTLELDTPRQRTVAKQHQNREAIYRLLHPLPGPSGPKRGKITNQLPLTLAGFTKVDAWESPYSLTPGGVITIYAGFETDDPTQGAVVRWPTGNEPQGPHDLTITATPVRGGAVSIESVRGAILTLRPADGRTERYDAMTGLFAG
jgi:hypothetical protein